MRISIIATSVIIFATPGLAQPTTTPVAAGAQIAANAEEAAPKFRTVCVKQERTGTRLPGRKVCHKVPVKDVQQVMPKEPASATAKQ